MGTGHTPTDTPTQPTDTPDTTVSTRGTLRLSPTTAGTPATAATPATGPTDTHPPTDTGPTDTHPTDTGGPTTEDTTEQPHHKCLLIRTDPNQLLLQNSIPPSFFHKRCNRHCPAAGARTFSA